MVDEFTYLESTISSKRSLDQEIDRRISKAASTLARLGPHVCLKKQVTQDRRINTFHVHSLKKLIGISWTSRTPNTDVLF